VTSSAASSVQPPEKTASAAKRRCSSGSSSSKLQAIVARRVRYRSGRSRAPPLRSGRSCASRSRICAGRAPSVRRPASSERQLVEAATDLGDCVVGPEVGLTARARAKKPTPSRARAAAPGTLLAGDVRGPGCHEQVELRVRAEPATSAIDDLLETPKSSSIDLRGDAGETVLGAQRPPAAASTARVTQRRERHPPDTVGTSERPGCLRRKASCPCRPGR
jgi:hypothetical protein